MLSELEKEILNNIKSQLSDETLGIQIIKRLKSLSYKLKSDDSFFILFCIQKAQNEIKSFCNIKTIPIALSNILVDKVCGEFLLSKKNSGQLDIDDTLKSLKDGNITITYDDKSSDEAKMNALIDYLINGGRDELVCYRKIKWF